MPTRFDLPPDHRLYTDAYFLRSREILLGDGLDPLVTMQVFVRKGPGVLAGMDEAVEILARYGRLAERGGKVLALPEGSRFAPMEPLMHIEARLADIVELETMYLGVISAGVTLVNDGQDIDLAEVRRSAELVRRFVGDRRLVYFGSRHWHWSRDAEITRAAVEGGFDDCSTDVGARAAGLAASMGTIPHALVLAYGWAYGVERGTAEATLAFDRHIPADAPRVALVDTFCREVDDSLTTAAALRGRLDAVRIDTAGENVAQGAIHGPGPSHWVGAGVTVEGVRAVRDALREAGHEKVRIVLSSGFGAKDKLAAFVEAERRHGRLFDALGIGGLYPSRHATADIVRIEGKPFAKVGRRYVENPRLRRVI